MLRRRRPRGLAAGALLSGALVLAGGCAGLRANRSVGPAGPPVRSHATTVTAPVPAVSVSGLPTVTVAGLPPEARQTINLIDQGGPFPYSRDGATFRNREGILPAKQLGYYREYTVVTPGSPDRGARRIVAGAGGEIYYTDDHYDSFREVLR